jgi:hypothetical protein
MRVIEQLIDHLRRTGHLTTDQLTQLRQMGLLKDQERESAVDAADFDAGDDAWWEEPTTDPTRTDEWHAVGDRLLAGSRRTASGHRGGGRRTAAADSDTIAAVERSVARESAFLDLVLEAARRMDPEVGADVAPRLVGSVDPARFDAVVAGERLWVRLWPHILRDPVIDDLDQPERRRFSRLVTAGLRSTTWSPRRLLASPVVRHAVDIIEAHRALSLAFGRVASTVEPWRVFCELGLSVDPAAYEVLVILHSATTQRRTVADLPDLEPDVGLPTLKWLPPKPFDSAWAVAARVDPVRVLPFMQWCLGAWSSEGPSRRRTCGQIRVDHSYDGNWNPRAPGEWFGLGSTGDGKWARVRCTPHVQTSPGQFTQSIDREGIEFVHHCRDGGSCGTPRQFRRLGASWVLDVKWSDRSGWPWGGSRADYGKMWATGLFDMPLLTCPKDWELT